MYLGILTGEWEIQKWTVTGCQISRPRPYIDLQSFITVIMINASKVSSPRIKTFVSGQPRKFTSLKVDFLRSGFDFG